jgi:hypothetical protein
MQFLPLEVPTQDDEHSFLLLDMPPDNIIC